MPILFVSYAIEFKILKLLISLVTRLGKIEIELNCLIGILKLKPT